jgi:hyaluronoglucosaminidase
LPSYFVHRGIVEGFYGPPFDPIDRLWIIEQMATWGMNLYVYAPKDDPLGRSDWRTPYPEHELDHFRALVELGDRVGVSVGFALSPGISIEYASRDDQSRLREKLATFADLGSRFLCLALDDVPSQLQHARDSAQFGSLASAHVATANALHESLPDDVGLWVVPTDYLGIEASDYLTELGEGLAPEIEVGWTGRTVVSPTIRADEAERRASQLKRRLLIWDNTPVADGPMRPMLHLGPYLGRDAKLCEHATGLLLNPMQFARASAIALRTAAVYMLNPAQYDPEAAWRSAVAESAPKAVEAFTIFAAAHRFSALAASDRDDELERSFERVRGSSPSTPQRRSAVAAMRRLVAQRVESTQLLAGDALDERLANEIGPWLRSHRLESERLSAAVDLLDALESTGPGIQRALAFFRFEGRLTRLEVPQVASYGPRRVLYPQLARMEDDDAQFGSDPALYRDLSLADEIARFAEDEALRVLAAATATGD